MLLPVIQRLTALLSLVLLGAGAYLLWSWADQRQALEAGVVAAEAETWRLWLGASLLAVSVLGRTPVLWLLGRGEGDQDRLKRSPGRVVESTTGARLHVEEDGPTEAPALIFVHGWGLDSGIWREARLRLGQRYQVITYDLAGLGKSGGPKDEYSLDGFADDLLAVVRTVAPRKAILIGHSIGGMTLQSFARRHSRALGRDVVGLVLENTTHTDPTRTTILGRALHASKPLLEPLMRLDTVIFPLVWLMNWQSYLSGGVHVAMRFGGFGQRPTRAQLEQVARAVTRNHPGVQAKGNLAMMRWDATHDLPQISVPTLVFIGGRDIVTIPAAGERIAEATPGGRLFKVPGAGHLGPMELAGVYNEAIARFADEVFTRGATWADRRAETRLADDVSPSGPAMGDEVSARPQREP